MRVRFLQKMKAAESRAADQVVLLQTYKEEISKLKASTQTVQEEKNAAEKELESFKQKFYELQRSERILRVDLEQSKSRVRKNIKLPDVSMCSPPASWNTSVLRQQKRTKAADLS